MTVIRSLAVPVLFVCLLAGCCPSHESTTDALLPTATERAVAACRASDAAHCDAPGTVAARWAAHVASVAPAGGETRTSLILDAPADPSADAASPAEPQDRWWQKPLAGRSAGEILVDDLKLFPRELWKSTRDSANVPSLAVLALAGGLSAISRGSWDDRVDRSFQRHDRSFFDKTGDTGSVLGNPLLHFGLAAAAYGYSIEAKNDEVYGFSKDLFQALVLNGLVTTGLKLAANDYSPNGEWLAWPSGHTSSTATVAAVAWEHYGPVAGVPLYLLTGFVATSRLQDREHWLSDVIFGAVLGSVIGHSVAQGRSVEVGGFTVLPYIPPDGGAGILFARQF